MLFHVVAKKCTSLTVKRQLTFALEEQIPYVIWIGADEMRDGKVKLKNTETKSEELMSLDDAIAELSKSRLKSAYNM